MKKIVINKLVILGEKYKRTVEFNKGLTIIRGEKTSGKSLILSLIDYCLGKSEKMNLNVQKQLSLCCDDVLLEFSIGEKKFVFKRNIKKYIKKINIYFCEIEEMHLYTPKVAQIQEAMAIIMRNFNIIEYKNIKNKIHSEEQTIEVISFRDIFRYVYVNQHMLGTQNFLENKATFKKYKNPYAFELIFNLIKEDKDGLNFKLVEVTNNLERTKKEILGLESYLKDKNANNFSVLIDEELNIKRKLEKKLNEKQSLIKKSENINTESQIYIKLKTKLTNITDKKELLIKEKCKNILSIKSKKNLINDYKYESREVEETLEINYKLSIANQHIECPLCSSKVEGMNLMDDNEAEKILKYNKKSLNNKIKLVYKLIKKEEEQNIKIDTKMKMLEKEESIYNEAIIIFSKDIKVPYLSGLDSINSIINNYQKRSEAVNECIRLHNKITEKNNDIVDFESEIIRLKEQLNTLKIDNENKDQIFEELNKSYKGYMQRFKYKINETYIDSTTYIPYYDGANIFEHESGGLLECMQISFLCAILASKNKGYAEGHPGILLMDTISKYIGTVESDDEIIEKIEDPEIYEEIYKVFEELADVYQFIIVENTPPVNYNKFAKYTFFAGSHGLINLELNELK